MSNLPDISEELTVDLNLYFTLKEMLLSEDSQTVLLACSIIEENFDKEGMVHLFVILYKLLEELKNFERKTVIIQTNFEIVKRELCDRNAQILTNIYTKFRKNYSCFSLNLGDNALHHMIEICSEMSKEVKNLMFQMFYQKKLDVFNACMNHTYPNITIK